MTNRYASKTTVTAERTKVEIEQVLRRYGADQFLHGWEPGRGVIAFRLRKHPVRMTLPLPELEEFREYQRGNSSVKRTEEAAHRAHEQAEWQAWRALLLVVKANGSRRGPASPPSSRNSSPEWFCPTTPLWGRSSCPIG